MNETSDIREFRRRLRGIEREILLRFRHETGCCRVNFAQCHLLLALDEAPEAGIQELSESLGMDKAHVSRTVESLVESGFLQREAGTEDRRRVSVRLTEDGEAKTTAIHELCDREYRELFESVSPEERVRIGEAATLLSDVLTRWRAVSPGNGCCGNSGNTSKKTDSNAAVPGIKAAADAGGLA